MAQMELPLNRFDVEFLSILAGDKVTYKGGWGAWMTVCGEDLKGAGYCRGTYEITEKGLSYLEWLSQRDGT